ncbi:MAG TPA: cupredoxin domain-containing protein, partial [Rubrobacteraceae bacterium]|nr:cupredoxin domain-containing protein [Rubrobacteraceae bacterium]
MANRVPGGTIRRAGILLVIILGAAVLSFVGKAYSHEDDGGSVVVHVTDEGFEPRSITVEAGRTVVFENAGDEAHWPASDDHPTHQEYPGFDPKKPVPPGEEWSFTFDRPGEWGYHDHMNPYL